MKEPQSHMSKPWSDRSRPPSRRPVTRTPRGRATVVVVLLGVVSLFTFPFVYVTRKSQGKKTPSQFSKVNSQRRL